MRVHVIDNSFLGLEDCLDALKEFSFSGHKSYCCHSYSVSDGYIYISSLDDLISLAKKCNRVICIIPGSLDDSDSDITIALDEKIKFS